MTDDRIDLSLLDPAADPDRIERIVGAVRARIAASEIAEPWVAPLARAWIPALAAAALAGLLALAVPRSAERPAPAADSADPLAVSLGVPSQLAGWATSEEFPSTAEVLTAIQPSSPDDEMMDGPRIRKRFGFRAALTVAGVFLAGLLLGLAIARWRSPASPAGSGDLSEALAELDLTADQRARIDHILTSGQGRTDRVLEEVLPRVQAVVDSVDGEIRHVLTDRQRVRLEEIRQRHVIVRRQVVDEDPPDGDDADSLGQ